MRTSCRKQGSNRAKWISPIKKMVETLLKCIKVDLTFAGAVPKCGDWMAG
jgi:hypothetical protein